MITLFKIKKTSQKGFTLIELLTSIAVVIILTGIVFANYRSGERQYALQRSAHKLAQDIRRIQEMATSTREFNCGGSLIIPPGGYGVFFPSLSSAKNYYILFADCNGDFDYDSPGEMVGKQDLEKGITLSAYMPSVNQEAWVVFTPPDPTTAFNKLNNTTLTINLTSGNPPNKAVFMNIAGLIEVP